MVGGWEEGGDSDSTVKLEKQTSHLAVDIFD